MFIVYFQNNNSADEEFTLTKDEVQMSINAANLDADSEYQSKF